MTSFMEAVALIDAARTFEDLVAPGPGPAPATPPAAGGRPSDAYRRLVRIVHPDAVPAAQSATATAAFAKLSALWAGRGSGGGGAGTAGGPGPLVAAGDLANLYAYGADLLKVPRRPADNDLMAAEAAALRTLDRDGDPRHRAYAPRLRDSFTHEDGNRVRRSANVLERLDGFVPLSALRRRVDPRDAAWMWRRLLTGLGWAHRAGVVHGAVLPEHVLIHPARHGVVLVDWCYSTTAGGPVPALVARHRDDYPPEVAAKRPATAATDIFMAVTVIMRIIDDPPAAMRRFADGCLYDAPRMRPQDAWHLLAELDELLDDLYGPRTFRPFTL